MEEKEKTIDVNWAELAASKGRLAYYDLAAALSIFSKRTVPPKLILGLSGSDNQESLYVTWEMPKKRGGKREISVPRPHLKWVQKCILRLLTHHCSPHKCAKGFVTGESIVSHASLHCDKRIVYTLDIDEFFPSVTSARIYGMLQAFPFHMSPDLARIVTNLTVYRGKIPQGAPTSPYLSNMVCRKLDSRLYQWASRNQYTYSRYADDLTFSTNRKHIPRDHIDLIAKTVNEEGFDLNPEKTRQMYWFNRQLVTGLVVNKQAPRPPREYRRNLRAIVHNIQRFGVESQLGRLLVLEDPSLFKIYVDAGILKCSPEEHQGGVVEIPDTWGFLSTSRLSRVQFEKIKEAQKNQRLLIRSKNRLNRSKDAASLIRVIKGKLEYLKMTRGLDNPEFRQMKGTLSVILGEDPKITQRKKIDRKDLPGVMPLLSERVDEYAIVAKEIDGKSGNQLTEYLLSLAYPSNGRPGIVEYLWLTQKKLNEDDTRKSAKQIAFRAKTTAEVTGEFFQKQFKNREALNGLLHHPDDVEVSPGELFTNAWSIFDLTNKSLPNALRDLVEKFLDKCRSKISKDSSTHPWLDEEFRRDILLPFKRATRFGNDPNDTTDLITALRSRPRVQSEQIDFPSVVVNAYTLVSPVVACIEKLISSMVDHAHPSAAREKIRFEMQRDEDEMTHEVVRMRLIRENDRVIGNPRVDQLFRTTLQKGLSDLRGFANWEVIADFEDGKAYRLNVMDNRSEELSSPAGRFEHCLTFYF